jgi:WD40 repeat protein
VLGSPHYLPPEQAAGQRTRLSRQTDVYALGATLYHLLTGHPPFQAESLARTLDLVLHAEPVSPGLLIPGVPRDLETICLKCLEKDPDKRYPNAEVLADEFGRFLEGKPILARPVGPLGKTWRWGQRNPLLASATSATVLSLVIGLAGASWQWRRAEMERQRAEAQAYISDMGAAEAALKANNPARIQQLLDRYRPGTGNESRKRKAETDVRGFEWRYLWQQHQGGAEALIGRLPTRVNTLEASRDGRWLVACTDGGTVKLWDLIRNDEIQLTPERDWPNYATFSRDSRLMLFTDQTPQAQGTIVVWDLQTRQRLKPILVENRPVIGMLFSADDRLLSVGSVTPKIADETQGHIDSTTFPAKRLDILDFPSRAKVNSRVFRTPHLNPYKGLDWVFTADNRGLIYAETEPVCKIALWNFAAETEPQYFDAHREGITALALRPDGRFLATGSAYFYDPLIRLWEVPTFPSLGELSGHGSWIAALKFSPDGQTLASAGANQTIRIWRVDTKAPVRTYRGLKGQASRVCFSHDSQKLYSAGFDGAVYRWSATAQGKEGGPILRAQTGLQSLTVSPDCTQWAGLRQGNVYLGRFEAGSLSNRVPELGAHNKVLLFSADGHRLFCGAQSGEIQVWSLEGHGIQASPQASDAPVGWLGQDTQGRLLVAVHSPWGKSELPVRPRMVSIWNTTTWQRQKTFPITGLSDSNGFALSPNGRWLATEVREGGSLQVWRTDSPQTKSLGFAGKIVALAFSPDNKLLAAATWQGLVKFWETPSFREGGEFRAEAGDLKTLAFSPDSRRLVTGGELTAAVRIWDVATTQQIITLDSIRWIDHAVFSTDGNQIAGMTVLGDMFLWRAPSLIEIDEKEKTQRRP